MTEAKDTSNNNFILLFFFSSKLLNAMLDRSALVHRRKKFDREPFFLSQHRDLFSKLMCYAYKPQNGLKSTDASLITKNSSLMRQILLQTAVMPFLHFSISPSFSFLEFRNCNKSELF